MDLLSEEELLLLLEGDEQAKKQMEMAALLDPIFRKHIVNQQRKMDSADVDKKKSKRNL